MLAPLLFTRVSTLSRGLTTLLHPITCTVLGLFLHHNLTVLLMAGILAIAIAVRTSASVSSVSLDALLYSRSFLLILRIVLLLLCDTPRSHATLLISAALTS